jgi:hypothetical protein
MYFGFCYDSIFLNFCLVNSGRVKMEHGSEDKKEY